METSKQHKAEHAPRSKEMQETINHLILSITMWLSVSITCVTTLVAVGQPWCLCALLLPFTFTMFPQIQKFMAARLETNYFKYKHREEQNNKKEPELLDKAPVKEIAYTIEG